MTLDSSVLVAILFAEPGYLDLVDAVLEADVARVGAPTLVETAMALAGRRGSPVGRELDGLVRELGITVVPFGEPEWQRALDAALQEWLRYYNERHHHRTIQTVPQARLAGYQPRPLPPGDRPLRDICALRETRKVAKDHTVSLDGHLYTLPREPNLVAFTVELRVRPGATVRVWHQDQFIAELPHAGPPTASALTVDQVLERVLPRLTPKNALPPPAERTIP